MADWEEQLRATAPNREVAEHVRTALSTLLEDDVFLFAANANERSISHRFATHLEAEFPDWNVDCEYNRDGYDSKRLHLATEKVMSNDTEGTTVYPDIIVHKRGTGDNLLVVEIKKTTGGEGQTDRDKLRAFQTELGYELALFVRFDVGSKNGGAIDEIEWILNTTRSL